MQAREEKKVYCEECQVFVHAVHQWTSEGNQSVSSLSDYTSHQATAVMVSIKPVLETLVTNGKVNLNLVSDKPMSQYRSNKIFYIIQQFANQFDVIVYWIYLKAGHGKSIPNGVDAVVKYAIKYNSDDAVVKHAIKYYSDDPHHTVDQLIQSGLEDYLPSVEIAVYSKDDVISIESKLPENSGNSWCLSWTI